MYNVLWRGHWSCATFDVRMENSSGSCRNIIQFFGSFVWPATFLLTPWPLFSLLASFRLSATYVSHTVSTRLLVGAAATDAVWIPSRRIHQTSKLPQSADSGLLLRHPRLCSQKLMYNFKIFVQIITYNNLLQNILPILNLTPKRHVAS